MADNALVTMGVLDNILPYVKDNILTEVSNKSINTEPVDGDLPVVYITGEIPTAKKYVKGEIEYISKTSKFKVYTYIKFQGDSSLQYPKKNFTIKLYKNEARTIKANKEFKNWGAHNNFVLKADYIDILHARNVVSAKLWSKVVQSRSDYDMLPDGIKNSPNNGAIDGFPVQVYINGEYCGLYCWTIPKCDWMVGMDSSNANHALLSAEFNDNGDIAYQDNPCNFNALWDGISSYFDVEMCTNDTTLVSSLNTVISAVMNSDQTTLEQVLDIKGAIDYFIFQTVILGTDGLAKNMLLATYDMAKWYLCPYDMDATFDLDGEGDILDEYDADPPYYPYNNRYSSLLTCIMDGYTNEYKARYFELRKSVLSYSSIINEFEKYIATYGEDIYIQDTINFPEIPSVSDNTLNALRTFVEDRLNYLDDYYRQVI